MKERNLEAVADDRPFPWSTATSRRNTLESVVAGAEGIFHLAAQPGVRGSWGASFAVYVHDNIMATQRLFEAAAAADIEWSFASSSSVYGDAETFPTREDARPSPVSPYGVTKLSCEQLAGAYARNFGLDSVGLRYFTVYGPRQRPDMAFSRILTALVDGTRFTLNGNGQQSRDFTYVGDAVARPSARWNGAGQEPSTTSVAAPRRPCWTSSASARG